MDLAAAHGITLEHGGNTVTLRPSLRAAAILERLHEGFANLFRRIAEFDTATITTVIEVSATDQVKAAAFLVAAADTPLKAYTEAVTGPLYALCDGLIPKPKATGKPTTGKPMPWAEVYAELFRTATGWLEWPPETAWNATPAEITEAFDGHLAKLKAIHGGADEETDDTDPEFDRAALHALKSKMIQGTPT